MPETLDRRSIIRRGIMVGTVAWTTPVIMDSVVSPVGAAATGTVQPAGCYKLRVNFKNCLANWNTSCTNVQTLCGSCCDPTPNSSAVCPAGYITTESLSTFCITTYTSPDGTNWAGPVTECTNTGPLLTPDYVQFRVNTTDPDCCFRFDGGEAQSSGPGCIAYLTNTGAAITFQKNTGNWNEFHLCVSCP